LLAQAVQLAGRRVIHKPMERKGNLFSADACLPPAAFGRSKATYINNFPRHIQHALVFLPCDRYSPKYRAYHAGLGAPADARKTKHRSELRCVATALTTGHSI
jgi:hypothetical protein